jgi:hypothetical protein
VKAQRLRILYFLQGSVISYSCTMEESYNTAYSSSQPYALYKHCQQHLIVKPKTEVYAQIPDREKLAGGRFAF